MLCVQSFSIHVDAACDHVAECGSVLSSGAWVTWGTVKVAVGDATVQGCSAAIAETTKSSAALPRNVQVSFDVMRIYWRAAAFLSSGAISYAVFCLKKKTASFPCRCKASER